MKIKSETNSNSATLELDESEVMIFKKNIERLIYGYKEELIIDCEIEYSKFKNINKKRVRFCLIDDSKDNFVSIINQTLTFNLDLDTYEYMLELIDKITSKVIPVNIIEVTEISSKKWKQSSYFVLSIIK